ncbi:acyl-CoA carboxylase subunit epsilon [Streptosporangium sandarakinum]|uniref:acyl-CoA carboxylase subunit epsilon n=1 Tax=Streptosporangium sandarakinum TaxID=1260955 RepID=UPI003723EF6A
MTELKIVHGEPGPEEVAALVIAITSRTAPEGKTVRKPGNWRDPAYRLRKPLPSGQGAWRSSGLPR